MPDEIATGFGALLRQYRRAAGLSQAELAERAGLSRRGIADLERGARQFPYGNTIRRLSAALDLGTTKRSALLAAGHRPDRTRVARRNALPHQFAQLIGRERELGELELVLKSARLVSLVGTAGIGKTRLAVALAERMQEDFEDGTIFVDLAPLGEPGLVAQAMALATGTTDRGAGPLVQRLVDYFEARQLLVVLDNCEHLIHSAAALIDTLVGSCPRLRIVATSREALRIEGEIVWPVPALRPKEAQQLFVQRAKWLKRIWTSQTSIANSSTKSAVGSMAFHWLSSWQPRR